jgi:thiamine pyrophosphokinase
VERHPVDKDRTDLAIALDLALEHAPARVSVIGGHGGRLDHHLANLLLLAADDYAALSITGYLGTATVTVIRGHRDLYGRPGEMVSLLPMHGPARGVTTHGLRFSLDGEDLPAGTSRGVSNEFTDGQARVELEAGTLVAIQPGQPRH